MRASLGPALRTLRNVAGLTQEELAERAGISARTVSDIERGLRTVIYADTARRLAAALELGEGEQRRFEALARGRSSETKVESLPPPATPLVGRSRELAFVAAKLNSDIRLLTLTGPGGIGKSRLALEAARRTREAFPGGVIFVSLGEIRDPGLVMAAIAKSAGVLETGQELGRLVEQRLTGTRTLVLLDTFEHLLEAAPALSKLMLRCPETTFMVTSQARLRLYGEHEFAVPPLELPPESGVDPPRELLGSAATELFVQRALAVRPDLRFGRHDVWLIIDICRRLEGLPLAIELAAARVKHLPLGDLRDQLDHRLRLLTGGPLDLPPRQRTMAQTIAWSHDLLGDVEKVLLRRLAVFSGGWRLTAVAPVCGVEDGVNDALEGVSGLVDKSLVMMLGAGGEARFDMLDVVREYALERLVDAGESELVGRRHALYMLELAEATEPHLVRIGQAAWYRGLDHERGNLRTALAWAIDHDDKELALRFTIALWRYWRQVGAFVEGRHWSDAALETSGDADASLQAKALWATAFLAYPQGDYMRMAELAPRALEAARRSGDPMDMRNALTVAGQVAMCEGRYADAVHPFRDSLEICGRLGLTWQLGTSYMNLANSLLHSGAMDEAVQLLQNGLTVYRQLGDETFAARVTNHLAQAALALGDFDEASQLAERALAEFLQQDERMGVAEALLTLAAVAASRHDVEPTATLAAAAASIHKTIASRSAGFETEIPRRLIDPIEKSADHATWSAAWERGLNMSADEVIEYVDLARHGQPPAAEVSAGKRP